MHSQTYVLTILLKLSFISSRSLYMAAFRLITIMNEMKLPKDILALLDDFWAEEYESDYRRFIELEKTTKRLG